MDNSARLGPFCYNITLQSRTAILILFRDAAKERIKLVLYIRQLIS